jgi:hypothetical protein
MRFFVAVSALVASAVAGPAVLSHTVNGVPIAGYAGAYAPAAYAPAPYAAPAYTGSQFHAQDEFGNLNYGYANLNSAKQEVGNTYGGVQGGYSYVDAAGVLQQVQYVADGAGFRVADSRLPVAPTFNPEPLVAPTFNPEPLVAPVFNPELPVAPELTPEVAEATAAHLAAVAAAAEPAAEERKKREADPAVLAGGSRIISAPTPLIHNAPVLPTVAAPLALGYHGLGYAGYHGLGYAGYAGHLGYGLY